MYQSVRICTFLILLFLCASCKEDAKNSVNTGTVDSEENSQVVSTQAIDSLPQTDIDSSVIKDADEALLADQQEKPNHQVQLTQKNKGIQRKLPNNQPNKPTKPSEEKAKLVKTISHPNPVQQEDPSTSLLKPAIAFKNLVHEFGEITEGDIIDHKFLFKNIGNAPLEILGADVTCGCTTPSFPFLAIPPGETGFIGVSYNSVGKSGDQKPKISVTTNVSDELIDIYFSGFVKDKPKEKSKESKSDTIEKATEKVVDKTAAKQEEAEKEEEVETTETPEKVDTEEEKKPKKLKIFKRKKEGS